VLNGDAAVLIDCGSPFGLAGVEANLGKLGRGFDSVELTIATHCHYDHVGGAAALKRLRPEMELCAHESDVPALENGDADATCASWMFEEEVEPVKVDRRLADGDVVSAVGMDLKIYSMPGHSPGSIAVVAETPDGRVVFTGDCYVPSCDLVGYDFDALAETWRRLLDLDVDFICPGHYDHHYTHPVVRAMAGGPGARAIRSVLLNPEVARLPSSIGTLLYKNSKVPLYMKSFYRKFE